MGAHVELEKVSIKRIIGPTPSGAAVLLGNEKKTFVVFIGFYEAAALIREINNEAPARPLTHELIQNVFIGFDVEVKQLVISSIIENTFCATLILRQRIRDDNGEWVPRRNEVRIDARPSDCFVLALKNKVDIHVTSEVFEQVPDVSNMAEEVEGSLTAGHLTAGTFSPSETLGEEIGQMEFEIRGSEEPYESESESESGADEPDDSFLGPPAEDFSQDDDEEGEEWKS